jgi:hypothetical protein
MEIIHDRNNQEFKIELDKSAADKGFFSSSSISSKIFKIYFKLI